MADKRDWLIKEMTQKIARMITVLRDDPQFSKCSPDSLKAYSGIVVAKYSGLSHLNSEGITLNEMMGEAQ